MAEHDTDANPQKAIDVARRVPHGELASYPVRHFDVYTGDTREQLFHEEIEILEQSTTAWLRSGHVAVP